MTITIYDNTLENAERIGWLDPAVSDYVIGDPKARYMSHDSEAGTFTYTNSATPEAITEIEEVKLTALQNVAEIAQKGITHLNKPGLTTAERKNVAMHWFRELSPVLDALKESQKS